MEVVTQLGSGLWVISLWVSHLQLHQAQTDPLVFHELCNQGCHVAQLHGSSAECSVKELLTAGFSPENKSERRAPKGDFILEAFLNHVNVIN